MQDDINANKPTLWMGDKRGCITDWATQKWVRLTGRTIDLQSALWLQGPIGETRRIGEEYFEDLAQIFHLKLKIGSTDAGLVEDFSVLRSSAFSPEEIHPKIRDFYEHTANYNLEVLRSHWHVAFKPFGWLLAILFSRRLQQLNMPLSSLEISQGITSDIIQLTDETGVAVATGWLRKFVATNSVIYAGIYSTCKPPEFPGKCIKVVFPLPNGNATIIMKPQPHSDGSLTLVSSGNGFGEPGFYLMVQKNANEVWAKYLHAMKESIHVYVDDTDELQASHILNLWGATFLKLHYRMRLISADCCRAGVRLSAK